MTQKKVILSNLSVESCRKKRSVVARNNNDNNKKKALSPNERNRELQKWRDSWFKGQYESKQ